MYVSETQPACEASSANLKMVSLTSSMNFFASATVAVASLLERLVAHADTAINRAKTKLTDRMFFSKQYSLLFCGQS